MTEVSPPLALDTVVFARALRTLGNARPSLAPMDLDILPGEIFAIVGRAGLTVEEALTLFGAFYERRLTTASSLETMGVPTTAVITHLCTGAGRPR